MINILFHLLLPLLTSAACPNLCSGHGECSRPDLTCNCFFGWTGGDCSLRACKLGFAWSDQAISTDNAHNLVECSDRGTCDHQIGMCVCMAGFEGRSCERMSCPIDCNGHGTCVSMRYYAQESDIYNQGKSYGDKIWDADKNFGCVCDEFYAGYDCSLRECPVGDDPMTSGQANEIQQLVCTATEGTFTLTFYKQGPPFRPMTTPAIAFNAPTSAVTDAFIGIADVVVTYKLGTEFCAGSVAATRNVVQIEFKQDFGDLPVMIVSGDQAVKVQIFGAAPDYGATGEAIVGGDGGSGHTPTKGTKENVPCSGRGFCDTLTGVCTCYTAFQTSNGVGQAGPRGDCGSPKGGITACPGTSLACSGHGYCLGSPTFQCVCSAGYAGGDCSERTCPNSYSWFDTPVAEDDAHYKVECSNMGTCDKTKGECKCRTNFEGAACERMSCPGGEPPCSGHGTCFSQAQLAENSLIHSNGARTDITYGKIPNYKYTWDYNKVWGCQCDQDYTGYDCSLRLCPKGDDPITGNGNGALDPLQVNEVQTVYCLAKSGSFRLRFRNYETIDIPWNSDIYGVESALEALQSVGGATFQGDVTVQVTRGNPECGATACCAHSDGRAITSITDGVVISAPLHSAPAIDDYLRIENAKGKICGSPGIYKVTVANSVTSYTLDTQMADVIDATLCIIISPEFVLPKPITSITLGVVISAPLSNPPAVGDYLRIENAVGKTCGSTGVFQVTANAAASTTSYTLDTTMTNVVDPSFCVIDGTFYGNVLKIYFVSELSNLPKLVVSQNKLGPLQNGMGQIKTDAAGEGPVNIYVTTIQDGTTENAECSNRGICNRANGVCSCFPGFGSSNGKGRHSIAGTRGDCGYVLPVYVPTAQ